MAFVMRRVKTPMNTEYRFTAWYVIRDENAIFVEKCRWNASIEESQDFTEYFDNDNLHIAISIQYYINPLQTRRPFSVPKASLDPCLPKGDQRSLMVVSHISELIFTRPSFLLFDKF